MFAPIDTIYDLARARKHAKAREKEGTILGPFLTQSLDQFLTQKHHKSWTSFYSTAYIYIQGVWLE